MSNFEKIDHTDSDAPVLCPKDEIAMERYRIGGEGGNGGGVEIDRCPRCGGVYLDKGELTQLMAASYDSKKLLKSLDKQETLAGSASRAPVELKCPRDGNAMSTHRVSDQKHLEYEVCGSCGGVFFDAGELNDLSKVTLFERVKGFLRG